MVLWRVSNHPSLTGEGGLRASARWHTRGGRVVYCAQSPAAALLEILVHFELDVDDLPTRYRLLKIDVPDDLEVEHLPPGTLSDNWLQDIAETRLIGDSWLGQCTSPMLAVPSAIVPETLNILLNPEHPEAERVVLAQVNDHTIDRRLLGC